MEGAAFFPLGKAPTLTSLPACESPCLQTQLVWSKERQDEELEGGSRGMLKGEKGIEQEELCPRLQKPS